MSQVNHYKQTAKQALVVTKRQLKRVTSSKYAHSKKVWVGAAVAALVIIFVGLPVFAAKAPSQVGYGIKRSEEALATNLAPLSSWRTNLRLDFADRRIEEAAYVARAAHGGDAKEQAKASATISKLLGSYEAVYEDHVTSLQRSLTAGNKPSNAEAKESQRDVIGTYTKLQLLRLQAPQAAQTAILTAIDDAQQNVATLDDILKLPPVTGSDLSQLAKLIPYGVLSKAEVDQLASATSNRQLHTQIKSMIEDGQLPSDISYLLDLDDVKQLVPGQAAAFEATAEFEQMKRISAVIQASRPTSQQQQAIKNYLSSYKPGTAIPQNDTTQYVVPIVYGMALAAKLQSTLPSLDNLTLTADNQALVDSWKGSLAAKEDNLGDLYQNLLTDAQVQPKLHSVILTSVQNDLVTAQKQQVAYLVMPPGWDNAQMSKLNYQMGVEIAETNFKATKPDVDQQLSRTLTTQNQLQNGVDKLRQEHTIYMNELTTKINNFNGTPEELAALKKALAQLDQSQTATINNLQTQITNITDSHVSLDQKVDNLRQEQLTALYELELRATTHAQTLTTNVQNRLNNRLDQIDSRSQTLINNLQDRVDSLDSSQSQLHTQLTNEITTIKNNYQTLTTNVQAQLDAGVATTNQLQTILNQAQNDITNQQHQLSQLGSDATDLRQLVNQVKTDSTSQVQDLQDQIDVINLDQQTIRTAVTNLQTVQQTSQNLISSLQTHIDGLGADQTQLRNQLTSQIETTQDSLNQFTAYVQAQLDAGVATSTQLNQTVSQLQASLASQQTQLNNLGANLDGLSTLVNQVKNTAEVQVDNLQTQIENLSIDQQAVQVSLNDLRDTQAADIENLNSQVASLSVLQTEAQTVITALSQRLDQAQSSVNDLSNNVTILQAALADAIQTQASLLSTVSDQQSELSSLTTQTQTALDSLTAQQTQLASQISTLSATTSNLSQTVASLQTTANNTQTQLNTLLASPPWAIPEGIFVTQSEFDALAADLNTLFAQKSAQIDAQFQAYQQQLNTTVSQLNSQVQQLTTTTTNTANQQNQLQTQVNNLSSQVQTLQSQLQQLLNASTPGGTGL